MTDTYTYTARNADNPDQVMTFALENNHLHLYMTGVLETLGQVSQAENRGAEAKHQLRSQAKAGTLKFIEGISGPIHINDVGASFDGEQLRLIIWQRLAGLRLAPLWINLGRVDNSDAADAFVAELDERKAAAPYPGRFFGPLDYWLGWTALCLMVAVLLRWPSARRSE